MGRVPSGKSQQFAQDVVLRDVLGRAAHREGFEYIKINV